MKLHKMTCQNCNGMLNMEVAEGTTSVYCPYCGQMFFVDDGKREYTVNKNINHTYHERYTNDADVIRAKSEANKSSMDFKQLLILMGIMLLIPLLALSILSFNAGVSRCEGKISAGDYEDLVGKDYKTVKAHFEAAGFTDIELIDLNDSGVAFWNDGKVETISV